ncbi:NADH:ubiquinone oxidoreductase 24 kD subunit [Halobacteroides halobius DSM 5150]|uniref:NADH:ubiquinone oxidoreductase 24 kD subunit n=1 Tax=Halobacteroides halobius (strain ATCC 35273 / DSM 5150 / MD-1) TaxID=748449 RepID=L0K442_HALHC|nr:NAD(P)H-dependent oxidoreductase subunit E [Halobacteroides halobius]AGB40057.1 NADH:ubiquinone oxidoreductase 24 kD subunit [Halobacteroides halobius DSM 5150]
MNEITVCVGSSCHLKGAPQIIKKLKKLVRRYDLETEVNLSASFCLGCCTEGVIVKFDEEIITNVSPDNIVDIFYSQLEGEI